MKNTPPSILIVDDNLLYVDRMVSLLKDFGIPGTAVATSYQEALQQLDACKPEIVLLDINLPGKNGVELLKEIRQAEYTCRVIMLSNYVTDYYRRICMELGVTHFLDKSNDFNQVPGLIKNMILMDCIATK